MFFHLKKLSKDQNKKFPISKEDLVRFSVFMFKVRKVAPSTIRQYLTASKTIHAMLEYSLENFSSTTLKYVLRGFENQYKAMEQDNCDRRAFTFPLLKLFAEAFS